MDMPVEKNFHLESVMNVLEKFQAHNQVKKKKSVGEAKETENREIHENFIDVKIYKAILFTPSKCWHPELISERAILGNTNRTSRLLVWMLEPQNKPPSCGAGEGGSQPASWYPTHPKEKPQTYHTHNTPRQNSLPPRGEAF